MCVYCGVDFSVIAVKAMGSKCKVLPDNDSIVCGFCNQDPCVGNPRRVLKDE